MHELLLHEVLRHDRAQRIWSEVAVAEWTGPYREVRAVVAATLAPTGTDLARVGYPGSCDGLFECSPERFTMTKGAVAQIDAGVRC